MWTLLPGSAPASASRRRWRAADTVRLASVSLPRSSRRSWSPRSCGLLPDRTLRQLKLSTSSPRFPFVGQEPGPGEYLHRSTSEFLTEAHEVLGEGEFRVEVALDVDRWLSADGSGERRSVVRGVSFPSPEDERAWSEVGPPAMPVVGDVRRIVFGPGEGPLVNADDIPTDPDELVTWLRESSIDPDGPSDARAFALVGDLLAQGNLPAMTRAALLEAAAELEGVQLLGPDEDSLGRAGESFAVRSSNVETRLLFDPETGALLARETYEPSDSGTWGLVDWQAYLGVDLVARIPADHA